jgi:hypothetical protein
MPVRTRLATVLAGLGLIVSPVAMAGHAAAAAAKSSTFAGYEVSHKMSVASATIVVPTITCKKNFSGVGPTIFMQSAPNKKNIFTDSGGGVGVACEQKMPIYQMVITIRGAETNFGDQSLVPGDKLEVTVQEKKSKTKVTVDDVTLKDSHTLSGKGSVGAAVFFGDEGVSFSKKNVGIDPFTPTTFSNSQVDGKSLKAIHASPERRVHGSTVEIAVSPLTKGKKFTLTFKHA